MKPTNGQYMVLADLLGDALDRCASWKRTDKTSQGAHTRLRTLGASQPFAQEV